MDSPYLNQIRRLYCQKPRLVGASQEAALILGRKYIHRLCLGADAKVKKDIKAMERIVSGLPLDAECSVTLSREEDGQDGTYPVVVHVAYTPNMITLTLEITGSKKV